MWILILLSDDAEEAKAFAFNSFEEAFQAYKDELGDFYEGSFDTKKEEKVFYSALKDASTVEEVDDLADSHVGENDIKVIHLVESRKWDYAGRFGE